MAATSDRAANSGDDTFEARLPGYRYGALLLLLLALFFFIGSVPEGKWTPLITVLLSSMTLLTALYASGANRAIKLISFVAVGLGVAVAIGDAFAPAPGTASTSTVFASAAVSMLLLFVAPIVIIQGVLRRRMLDVKTVLAAICLYVILGMFFSFTYHLVQVAGGHEFFVQTQHDNPALFLYYSFITLTTVGFGDYTSAIGVGRTLSALEAMFGQIYLVTVVALLVTNLGPAFQSRRNSNADKAEASGQ